MKSKLRIRESDAIIGSQLRKLRKDRGLTQPNLANGIGVTFQQIQKYESGKNRISLSTAIALCNSMELPLHRLVPPEVMQFDAYHEMYAALKTALKRGDNVFTDRTKKIIQKAISKAEENIA